MTLKEDPHFEDVVNEIKDIQAIVDTVLFGSVFLRLPQGLTPQKAEQVPQAGNDVPTMDETIDIIDDNIKRCEDLEDRLEELLENENNASYEDQIEDYQRDLKEITKTLQTLKPVCFSEFNLNFYKILNPEELRNGQPGKTDISWLSWRRNTLGSKLHKELNDLQDLIIDEDSGPSGSGNNSDSDAKIQDLKLRLKTVNTILQTANKLHDSSQYLSWFTRRVIEHNESLPEYERDFTVNLVSQWVQEESNKVLEHQKNCINLRSELEEKLEEEEKNH